MPSKLDADALISDSLLAEFADHVVQPLNFGAMRRKEPLIASDDPLVRLPDLFAHDPDHGARHRGAARLGRGLLDMVGKADCSTSAAGRRG